MFQFTSADGRNELVNLRGINCNEKFDRESSSKRHTTWIITIAYFCLARTRLSQVVLVITAITAYGGCDCNPHLGARRYIFRRDTHASRVKRMPRMRLHSYRVDRRVKLTRHDRWKEDNCDSSDCPLPYHLRPNHRSFQLKFRELPFTGITWTARRPPIDRIQSSYEAHSVERG